MPFCTKCGAQVSDLLLNCPNCGERLYNQGNPPASFKALMVTELRPEDRSALSSIQKYAIIGLINLFVGVGVYGYFFAQSMRLVMSNPSTATPNSITPFIQNIFLILIAVFVAAAILEFLSLYFLREAFVSLRKISHEFSTPSMLTLVALISIPILFILAIFFYEVLFSSILLLAQNPSGPPSYSIGIVIALSLGLLVVSIAALIGEIGGILLGLWRVGSRYEEGLFKAAVIFTIIPFLSFIAPILELIGVHNIRKKCGERKGP